MHLSRVIKQAPVEFSEENSYVAHQQFRYRLAQRKSLASLWLTLFTLVIILRFHTEYLLN